ncbi:MAG: ABC transporter ATP-binding protein [Planctomycetota bacterium]|nr:ABC transporter ATP-binding protein [Planctomycetota bacterium]
MLLTTENLGKRYERRGVAVDALRAVDLEIEERAFVAVTGPSGSGKTTLLLTLAGLLKPTAGRIRFRDKQLEGFSDAQWASFRHANLGFVMQNFSLVPYLSARENVTLPLAIAGSKGAAQKKRATELLERVGLGDRASHLPRELSAGQQQRVAIARALANEPALVLADEPTGNLDPALATDVLDLLRSLNEESGTAILMVTHSPEAARAGTHRVHIEDGLVVDASLQPA